MKKILPLIISVFAAFSCAIKMEEPAPDAAEAAIFPDYKNITVPPNIAPPNFSLEEGTEGVAILENSGKSLILKTKKGEFDIPEDSWRELAIAGSEISVTVGVKEDGKYVPRKPFTIFVSEDKIEPYVAYRLIDPGYETWNKLGLY